MLMWKSSKKIIKALVAWFGCLIGWKPNIRVRDMSKIITEDVKIKKPQNISTWFKICYLLPTPLACYDYLLNNYKLVLSMHYP